MYSLLILETRRLKSRCQQGWFLCMLWGRQLFYVPLLNSGGCLSSLEFPGLNTCHSIPCLHHHVTVSLSLWISLSIRTPVIGFRAHSNPVQPHHFIILIFYFIKASYFVLKCNRLTLLWWFQVHSKGTQPYSHMYPFPLFRSHPGCHMTSGRVPRAVQ